MAGYRLYGTALPQLEEDQAPKSGAPQFADNVTEPSKPRVYTEIPGPKSKDLIKNLDRFQVRSIIYVFHGRK